MLTEDPIREVFSRIQKFSSADEVEAIFAGGQSALTRFANNTIHQNVAEEGYVVSIRVAMEGKTARATTNRLDDASLRRAVESAEQIARVQERDPDLLPTRLLLLPSATSRRLLGSTRRQNMSKRF
jgi:PmbA protein